MLRRVFVNFFSLTRVAVSLSVTFTAWAAYTVHSGKLQLLCILPLTGIFFLASGSSALNQYQESRTDAMMERTKSRPLPSGQVSLKTALIVALVFILSGLFILLFTVPPAGTLLGLITVAWYNFVYTPLKKKTAFAIIPGSLTGALPVFIGWAAAGGSVFDATALFIAFFVFLWQIPHFWLLLMEYGSEYIYAGLPAVTSVFKERKMKLILFIWIVASGIFPLLFGIFGMITGIVPAIVLICLIIIFIVFASVMFTRPGNINFRISFNGINVFLLAVLLLLALDHLINI